MSTFAYGERVQVRPRDGLRVASHAEIFDRLLPPDWTEQVFTEWLYRRMRDGAIEVRALAASAATTTTAATE